MAANCVDLVAACFQPASVFADTGKQALVFLQLSADGSRQLTFLHHQVEGVGVAEQVNLAASSGRGALGLLHHLMEGGITHVTALQRLVSRLHPCLIKTTAT